MIPGPITSRCFPSFPEPVYVVESFVPGRYRETVERETLPGSEVPERAFTQECARIERIRATDPNFEPCVVRLLNGDLEEQRKEIPA